MEKPLAWDEPRAKALVDAKSGLEGPLLPILHDLQETFGYVDPRAVAIIAGALNVSRAEVFGTLSFYKDFKKQKPLGRTIKLCLAEACQARGADALAERFETKTGCKIDGGFHQGVEVETVYCLGNCALGPNALYDGELFGALTDESLAALHARAAREGVAP
ncbi:NADH-quinone oxidoreductase subunit E [Rhodoblastus acidophilus]|jgi:formate dehydrogenase subunit gamma|uniref:NADH-quinone oxidoreductase subunit E n=1 Tax=Rhodoblastus acidophilus TaxID=1074 RepID=A0A6N8DQQ4_RHOAC|nr:NAD(P)H-dependent oxidoreductase subunit E [Rhodoblastus acidophilus]MCW2274404.1 formate dehydrogenase subunit gamma [Rhodoblastus acidophilus]MTV31144.1 NADH-quinone oxidoreductase subunit E [Rhodoblastus acidophilus]